MRLGRLDGDTAMGTLRLAVEEVGEGSDIVGMELDEELVLRNAGRIRIVPATGQQSKAS